MNTGAKIIILSSSTLALGALAWMVYKKYSGLTPSDQAHVNSLLSNPDATIYTSALKTNSPDALTIAKSAVASIPAIIAASKSIAALVAGNVVTAGGTTAGAGAASIAAESAAGSVLTAGGTTAEAVTAATTAGTSAAGLSTLATIGIVAAPILLVLGAAFAWGVFDSWDPHSGFTLFTLNEQGAAFYGGVRKAGDQVWIPNSVMDRINSNPAGTAGYLQAYLEADRKVAADRNAIISAETHEEKVALAKKQNVDYQFNGLAGLLR